MTSKHLKHCVCQEQWITKITIMILPQGKSHWLAVLHWAKLLHLSGPQSPPWEIRFWLGDLSQSLLALTFYDLWVAECRLEATFSNIQLGVLQFRTHSTPSIWLELRMGPPVFDTDIPEPRKHPITSLQPDGIPGPFSNCSSSSAQCFLPLPAQTSSLGTLRQFWAGASLLGKMMFGSPRDETTLRLFWG